MQKKFNIYRSSAGSGKTFTLTKEYLKLVLSSPALPHFKENYYKHILAVTFTKDAANEMKERIISSLLRISKLIDSEEDMLLNAILQELKEEYPEKNFTREILIKRAEKVFAHLLHNYSDFAVSTIDSFNNRIVQSFTRDMGLPFNYMVELEQEEILEQATKLLLEEAGEKGNQSLTKVLVDFAIKQVDEEKSWDIERLLQDFGTNIFQEGKKSLIAQLEKLTKKDFIDSKNQLFDFKTAVEQEIKDLAIKGMGNIRNAGFEEKDFFYAKTGIYGFFQKYSEQIDSKFFTEFANKNVLKTIEEDKWDGSKNKISVPENLKLALNQIFNKLENLKNKYKSDYLIVTNLLPYIYLLATINEMDKKLRKLMSDKNKVHISDFNQKINQIVEREPIPYIYERIGERFKHILIDEFQDTSQMQWHNLIPLVSNSLGFDLPNMLVGDAKQAIYRWRSGNADLIVHLPHVPTAASDSPVAENAMIFREHFHAKNLDRNFRSKGQIIDFNNHLFEFLAVNYSKNFPSLSGYYKEVRQKIDENKTEGGHVQISFLSKESDYDEGTFEECLKIVRDLVENKGYTYRDIAILARTNTKASKLAERFLEHKIQVISSESLLLTYSPKVNFIVSFLRIMMQPLNPAAKADLLYFLYDHYNGELNANLPFDDNTHLAIGKVCNSFKFKDFADFIKEKFTKAFGGKSPDFKTLQYLSLYEVAEELIRTFELNFDSKQQIYLQKLLDVMLDYGLRNSNNLPDFLEYWDTKKSKISITTPETGNAIRIMTIHKSKGLQFPVVILPYTDWETTPKAGEKLWLSWENDICPKLKMVILPIKKELLETQFADEYQNEMQATFIDAVNMLYVALTRPEERLYILAKENKAKKPDNSSKAVPASVQELLNIYIESINPHLVEDELGQHFLLRNDENGKYSTKAAKITDSYELSYFLSTECRDKIRMRRDTKKVKVQQQQEVKTENDIDIQGLYDARKQGLLVHNAFERVKYGADIPRAVQKLVNEGYIKDEEKTAIEEKMQQIVALPEIADFFVPKEGRLIFNEKELIVKSSMGTQTTALGTQTTAAKILRPDKILIDNNLITIIDYKTGMEKIKEHTRQLDEYAQALAAIEGFENHQIQKFIVYTEVLKVKKVF